MHHRFAGPLDGEADLVVGCADHAHPTHCHGLVGQGWIMQFLDAGVECVHVDMHPGVRKIPGALQLNHLLVSSLRKRWDLCRGRTGLHVVTRAILRWLESFPPVKERKLFLAKIYDSGEFTTRDPSQVIFQYDICFQGHGEGSMQEANRQTYFVPTTRRPQKRSKMFF
jgi:hypothetical protein